MAAVALHGDVWLPEGGGFLSGKEGGGYCREGGKACRSGMAGGRRGMVAPARLERAEYCRVMTMMNFGFEAPE